MSTNIRDLPSARDAIADAFTAAGVRGLIHAVDIDTGHEIGIDSDELVVAASVFKVPVLVELCRQYVEGIRSPTERVRVGADEFIVGGGTGIAAMLDDVDLSLRDLSFLMMSVSDNRATDVIASLVGLDAVNATMRSFGLKDTVVELDCAGLFATIAEDLGTDLDALEDALASGTVSVELEQAMRTMRCVTPAETDRTTPREATSLLAALWRDEVVGPQAAAEVRRILGQQAWPHRLTSGFPDSRVSISGKTGTLFFVRNEVGVVEFPDGQRYAVAVFLQEPTTEQRNPDADRVIGTAAGIAVDYLRASQSIAAA